MTTPTDPKALITSEIERMEVPKGVDRRTFLMRSAVIGAAALIMDRTLQLALRMVQASD